MSQFKNVVVSIGPIPARLDSVKFITNKFKGGLAIKTAKYLGKQGHNVTIVAWTHTDLPRELTERPCCQPGIIDIVRVTDVFEYYDWITANARRYDAFVMAAAVANLTPVKPWEGKFPSHNYKPGDEFDIKFMIAPRAIDAVKAVNPRACLIGYKLFDGSEEELISAAKHTLADAKANVIFANHPRDAKTKKFAVMADGSVVPCTFDEHLALIDRAIRQEYYSTRVQPLTPGEQADPRIREALAAASLYEETFPGFGTVAVPVRGGRGAFATTARGHRGGPVLVRRVDHMTGTVYASAKATLNAPALDGMLSGSDDRIVVHRHLGDPAYDPDAPSRAGLPGYLFPGTVEEAETIQKLAVMQKNDTVDEAHHGYLKTIPILPVDWDRYHEQFPDKYFGTPPAMQEMINRFKDSPRTLELGANTSTDAKYAYDPYVQADGALNIGWSEATSMQFDLVYARNSVNYLSEAELEEILRHADRFVANTFLEAPTIKVDKNEVSVLEDGKVWHTLRRPDDALVRHWFFAHGRDVYERLGLKVEPYGRNSALITKGF